MDIKLYNSLTNKVEKFVPIKENELSMYVCGPTVYNHIHIGNARPVVFFDMIYRFFRHIGYQVKYVSNFTDIDDKIIAKAKAEGITEEEVANKYITSFLDTCDALGCLPLYLHPRVTECMDSIAGYIKALMDKGYAYQKGDNVYFRVRKTATYGILSNQRLDDLEVGARISQDNEKEDPNDFVLWKKTSDEGKKWDSPFGLGRPGWHTECCVMIDNIFGGKIDIHGGGNDLKFPHHENEIAQATAIHNHTIANYWVHNGRVDLKGEKMSKSLGNVVWTKDLIKEVPYQTFRLLLLSSQYRQTINYVDELLNQNLTEWQKIERSYLSLYRHLELLSPVDTSDYYGTLHDEFLAELANDLNTPNAITVLYKLMKEVNIKLRSADTSTYDFKTLLNTFEAMLDILGIMPTVSPLTEDQKALVVAWKKARNDKDYALADVYRAKITELGIKI